MKQLLAIALAVLAVGASFAAAACSIFIVPPGTAARAVAIYTGRVASERFLQARTLAGGEIYRPRLVTVAITEIIKGKARRAIEADVTSCGFDSPQVSEHVLVIVLEGGLLHVSTDRRLESTMRQEVKNGR